MGTTPFRTLRALQSSFRVCATNVVPFTLFALVVYAPLAVLAILLLGHEASSAMLDPFWPVPTYVMLGISTLTTPLLSYRVIQDVGGVRVSMWTSMKRGLRGLPPALLLVVVTQILAAIGPGLLDTAAIGLGIVGTAFGAWLLCTLFVITPVAVAERRGPIAALKRSIALTSGYRWRVLAQRLPIIVVFAAIAVFRFPMWPYDDPGARLKLDAQAAVLFFVAIALELFTRVLEAVTYVLLREAKDGVPCEELVRVFE
jgi:hypothetical protein